MLENYVALSITNILAMLLLAFVVGRNNLLDRKMKRFFSTAIFCTILVILAEIGTSVFGQPVASFSLPNMFFNVLGFSLSPFITISLAFVFNHKNYRNIFYLFLPAVTNMLLAMLSPKFGLIFSISQQNEYFRGPCFFVYVAACRKDMMGNYDYPKWLLILGVLTCMLTWWMGYMSFTTVFNYLTKL